MFGSNKHWILQKKTICEVKILRYIVHAPINYLNISFDIQNARTLYS